MSVSVTPLPDFADAETLFAGDSWSLLRKGEQRWVVSGTPSGWAMRLGLGEAEIRCARSQLHHSSGRQVLDNPLRYPLDQILLQDALSKPAEGLIVHAAGAVRAGGGLLFGGVSGAGKTTLARQLATQRGFELLSDDRVVVRRSAAGFVLWGTPWPGEGGHARNCCAPLCALFFLAKGPAARLERLSPSAALHRLLPIVSVPWFDRERIGPQLDLCAEVAAALPAFEFTFAADRNPAGFLERSCDNLPSI